MAKGLLPWPWPCSTPSAAEAAPGGPIEGLFAALAALPIPVLYVLIGVGAALENVVPPVPADTFVLVGAFLAARGEANPWIVFLVTWLPNVGSAVGVYALARHFGDAFFATPLGRFLFHPRQLEQVDRFYARWGAPAIFLSRFLPAFRAVVPVFAGFSRVPLATLLVPTAIASALWYGGLVAIGTLAGDNWPRILRAFSRVNTILVWVAAAIIVLVGLWWMRTRSRRKA